jgi:DNA-binding NarL/FixJ family response regulator
LQTFTRILVVEDCKPHRSLITALLSKCPGLKVVSEAVDGLGAVEQARQLKPDVILMDIGLPKINGFEAARRIFELAPSARIIFLTQEADADIVKGAINLGARGYILKQSAKTDLLPAIAAALQGKRFVSDGLDGELAAL